MSLQHTKHSHTGEVGERFLHMPFTLAIVIQSHNTECALNFLCDLDVAIEDAELPKEVFQLILLSTLVTLRSLCGQSSHCLCCMSASQGSLGKPQCHATPPQFSSQGLWQGARHQHF